MRNLPDIKTIAIITLFLILIITLLVSYQDHYMMVMGKGGTFFRPVIFR